MAEQVYDESAALAADVAELESVDDQPIDESTPEAPEAPEEPSEAESETEVEEPEAEEHEEPSEAEKKLKVTPVTHGRPAPKEITAKYPNFFKEFPEIRHMIFREGEYTKLYPTVDDAREASEKAENFSNFSEMLQSGTPDKFGEFLSGVKQGGENVYTNMVANFLPTLFNTDRETYYKVTTPVAASMLRNAFNRAKSSGDENLANAAQVLAQWALGDAKYATGEKVVEQLKPVEAKPQTEQQQFYQQRFVETKAAIASDTSTIIRSEIRKGLDPNNTMNDFTRDLMVDRILVEVGDTLSKDKRHMDTMNSLWRRAHSEGYAGNWKDRLKSAYLSGARAVMPAIRAKIRSAAFADAKASAQSREATAEKSANRREVQGSKNSGIVRGTNVSAKQVDWGNTSDLDFLNDKVSLKKVN
jgi:hypothetical protein